MSKKILYKELDLFDNSLNSVNPKDYCERLQLLSADMYWQRTDISRESALYVINNLFNVFNYRFRAYVESQSYDSWGESVLLKQVANYPKFGVTNCYFTYEDPDVICAFWAVLVKSDVGAEIMDGGVFYLHGSEKNENINGFLLRLSVDLDYDFFYIPKTPTASVDYLDIESYLDNFQTDIERRIDT